MQRSRSQSLYALLLASLLPLTADLAFGSAAEGIREEATRANNGIGGHPLPLVSHWTTGKHPAAKGWAPRQQIHLIEQGHYILPWFQLPDELDRQFDRSPAANRDYYEWAIKRARELRLPIVLVGSQWERFLSMDPYLALPLQENPNVVTPAGKVLPMVSPFGPDAPWAEVGRKLTSGPLMRMLQEWYPDPPKVMFLSNNEHAKLNWKDAENCVRYIDMFGRGRDDNFKRQVVADGWRKKYRAIQAGMRKGLTSESWQANAIFVGYDAFGPPHLGRWPLWKDYSLYTPNRIDPHPLMWDGGSSSYYTNDWNESSDYRVFSPQIEFMNLVYQKRLAFKLNPSFWYEFSVWDGYHPNEPSPSKNKRASYAKSGQTYSPERYVGMIQFGMWLLRPRVVREFRDWTQSWADSNEYFLALLEAVDEIHENPILRDWWRYGELVPNRRHQHPYRDNIPYEYRNEDRWFLLDADTNPPPDSMKLSSEIPVFSLALVRGKSPKREWLIYAHSPLRDRKRVSLTIPEYGSITVDVPVAGAYFVVSEGSNAMPISLRTSRHSTTVPRSLLPSAAFAQ